MEYCPDARLEPREIPHYAICAYCKEEIAFGEDHYDINGDLIHEDCVRAYIDRHFKTKCSSWD